MQENTAWLSVRRAVLSASLLLLLFVGDSCTRQLFDTQNSIEVLSDYFDRHIPRLMKLYDVPGLSVALVRNGELAWSAAYGYADPEHNRKMTIDAIYRVESISKSVTAWGVIRLAEQGLIDLDAPVQQYLGNWELPESEYSEQKVTIRRLLSHNAGMPLGTIGMEMEYSLEDDDVPSLQKILSHEARLIREPGSGFLYSNTGFNLLELLIEEVSGRKFAEYMADEVLTPLGMHDSSFVWNDRLLSAMPSGYDLQGRLVPMYVYPMKASGGLFAPVKDIARFVGAGMIASKYVDHAVLGDEGIRKLYTPQVSVSGILGLVADSYGLGYFIENLSGGQRAVWHGGQGHGWMAHFYAVPESGDGIVILTNSQRSWPVIAQMLSDWARWSGYGSVKMGRIIYGIIALRIFIGIVVLVSLWKTYRLVRGLHSGNRRWSPLSRYFRKMRLLQAVLGVGIMAALAWSASQSYLIVSSIFPVTVGWAGVSFFVLAIILILSALLPRVKN
ncbi:MAG: beta-lactamase family protein [Gammaproteobacteria bacterium]|nr:beta-lactamase family protein [Gammaproteobacteria bacterium]